MRAPEIAHSLYPVDESSRAGRAEAIVVVNIECGEPTEIEQAPRDRFRKLIAVQPQYREAGKVPQFRGNRSRESISVQP